LKDLLFAKKRKKKPDMGGRGALESSQDRRENQLWPRYNWYGGEHLSTSVQEGEEKNPPLSGYLFQKEGESRIQRLEFFIF